MRIKETKEVYEGEVTELTPCETENPMGGYGKTISHVIIGLKTAKGTKQLKVWVRVSEISLSVLGLLLLFLALLASISSSWSPSLSGGAARSLLSLARQLYLDSLSAWWRIFRYWSCVLLIETGDKPIITWLAAAVISLFGSTHLYVFKEFKLSFNRKGSWCSFVDHKHCKKWAELASWTLFCLSLWYTLTLAINECSWK